MSNIKVKKICYLALFCAISMICSYIETLIPFTLIVPGVKIGLANVMTLVILLTFGYKEAFVVMVLRVFIVGITFTNLQMMLYSMTGGILSLVMMMLFHHFNFSIYTTSIMGGIFHNIGQLLVALVILQSRGLLYYLPYLIGLGAVFGASIGILSVQVYQRTYQYIDTIK